MVGESGDLRLMAPIDAVEVAHANRDTIVRDQGPGWPARVAIFRDHPARHRPSDRRRKSGLPMMVHIDHPPPTLEDVLARLRPGDILTHCFRPFPNNPTTAEGGVREAVHRGAPSGGSFRHWPRHGLFRLQDGADDARQWVRARLHLERRSCALHRRARFRSSDDDVEVPLPRHEARRRRAGRDGRVGQGDAARRSRQPYGPAASAMRRSSRSNAAHSTMSTWSASA